MKREKLAAVGLTSALLLTGCAIETQDTAVQAVAPADAKGHVALAGALQTEITNNILQLETDNVQGNLRFASAVRVSVGNKVLALTAAHMLDGSTPDCANETMYQIGSNSIVTQYLPSQQSPVPRSSDYDWDTMDRVDAAAIELEEAGSSRAMPISSASPAVGSRVLLANFQELANGLARDTSRDNDGQWPAIFGGIIVGHFKNKLVVATGHEDSYGVVNDFALRGGSSGGAAIIDNPTSPNNDKLAGLTIATLNSAKTADQIDQAYGYELPAGSYTVGFIEPITTAIATDLDRRAMHAPECSQ